MQDEWSDLCGQFGGADVGLDSDQVWLSSLCYLDFFSFFLFKGPLFLQLYIPHDNIILLDLSVQVGNVMK